MVDYEKDDKLMDKELNFRNRAVNAVAIAVDGAPYTEEDNKAVKKADSETVLTETDSPSNKGIMCSSNSETDVQCNLCHPHQLFPKIDLCCYFPCSMPSASHSSL